MSATPALQQRIGAALFLGSPLHLTELTVALRTADDHEVPYDGYNGYQRAHADPGNTQWAATEADGKTRFSNLTPILFPAPTGNWGTVTACSLHDPGTNDRLATLTLDPPRVIENGDNPPVFLAGELVFVIG